MPMFSWLRKAVEGGKRLIGKVKRGLEKGLELYNFGKRKYGELKQRAADLPFVGGAASNIISEAERRVGDKYSEVTGRDIRSDIRTGERLAQRGLQGINLAEGMMNRASRMGAE
jgi:hypothetical protein